MHENHAICVRVDNPVKLCKTIYQGGTTIGNTRVSVAYYCFYDNIQLYEPLGKALLFTSIS